MGGSVCFPEAQRLSRTFEQHDPDALAAPHQPEAPDPQEIVLQSLKPNRLSNVHLLEVSNALL
jgi:hypothetical protein